MKTRHIIFIMLTCAFLFVPLAEAQIHSSDERTTMTIADDEGLMVILRAKLTSGTVVKGKAILSARGEVYFKHPPSGITINADALDFDQTHMEVVSIGSPVKIKYTIDSKRYSGKGNRFEFNIEKKEGSLIENAFFSGGQQGEIALEGEGERIDLWQEEGGSLGFAVKSGKDSQGTKMELERIGVANTTDNDRLTTGPIKISDNVTDIPEI